MSTQTSESLLMRLRLEPADDVAWGRFVERYCPLIRVWCRARGLGEADTQDVCQDVLARLVTALKSFSYDPSRRFRGWLRTIVVNALHDYHRQRRHQPARGSGDTGVVELLANQEAREDLITRLDQSFDLELLERAMATVQARVAPRNWQAFVRTVLEGRAIAETAQALEVHEGMIYVARCKIQKMLKREIQRLESATEFEESSYDDARRLSPASLLHHYLDQSFDPQPGDQIAVHLANCPLCRQVVENTGDPIETERWRRLWAFRRAFPAVGDDATPIHEPDVADELSSVPGEVQGFEIQGILGRGGAGIVYKARQVKLDRLVALKMLTAGVHASPGAIARLRAESSMIARFRHPHVVMIHDVGEHLGVPYLCLEFVEGGSLADRLGGKPIPALDAARLAAALARVVQDAHDRGIIHRDLKPANVLLTGPPDAPSSPACSS